MEIVAFLKDKFEYNFNRNFELISLLQQYENCYNGRNSLLLSHTINAHDIWNSRVLGKKCQLGVWDIHPLKNLLELNQKIIDETLIIFDTVDLEKVISYTTADGKNFESVVHEMMFHAINHSTYHRGQIYQLLKSEGVDSLLTDYVFFTRKGI